MDKEPCLRRATIKNDSMAITPAVKNNKIKKFYEGKEPYAFVTWAFFTEQERVTGEYWGEEVLEKVMDLC